MGHNNKILKEDDEANLLISKLYKDYAVTLKNYVARIVKVTGVECDIVQDLFLKLCEMKKEELLAIKNIKSYLFSMARHMALNYIDSGRNKKESSLGEVVEKLNRDKNCSGLFAHLEDHCLRLDVQHLLESLSPKYREMITLAYIEGKPRKEIARIYGVSIKAIEKRLTKCRREARRIWLSGGGNALPKWLYSAWIEIKSLKVNFIELSAEIFTLSGLSKVYYAETLNKLVNRLCHSSIF